MYCTDKIQYMCKTYSWKSTWFRSTSNHKSWELVSWEQSVVDVVAGWRAWIACSSSWRSAGGATWRSSGRRWWAASRRSSTARRSRRAWSTWSGTRRGSSCSAAACSPACARACSPSGARPRPPRSTSSASSSSSWSTRSTRAPAPARPPRSSTAPELRPLLPAARTRTRPTRTAPPSLAPRRHALLPCFCFLRTHFTGLSFTLFVDILTTYDYYVYSKSTCAPMYNTRTC